MEAVREVEAERDDDHDDQQDVVHNGRLAVLDENCLEDVGGVLASVDGFLELFVNVLPPDDRDRILTRGEQLGDRRPVEPVTFVLEIAQRVQLAARVLESLQRLTASCSFSALRSITCACSFAFGRICSTPYPTMFPAASST